MTLDKVNIANKFRAAINSYDENALIQQEMSKVVSELVVAEKKSFGRVLEIGAGSGFLTKKIIGEVSFEQYFINDLMEEHMSELLSLDDRLEMLVGDIECLTLPKKLELVVSSSTLQWIDNIEHLIERIYHVLEPGGMFVFQTFGPKNLNEIRRLTGQGLEYKGIHELSRILNQAGFDIVVAKELMRPLILESPLKVLRHLKATGVTGNAAVNARLGFHKFEKEYKQRFSTDLGVRLTYHPIIIQVKKHG